ncbi:DUF6716 putative glycosyltransferase [Microlunatus speluncae]|uniref:DUF6716 putative glycosyltransferase n=1 Tax=Microlunatus speluncae TaxID=2594267 RepID=UPI001C2CEEDB|nr:DUF6716 putative glycosyltransferase [Microlunatus speluncae]
MKNALFIAAFDSQLKWCGRIRDEFASRGYACRVVVPDVRSALSAQQIRDAGFDGVDSLSWSDLLDVAVISDVVVCGLSGPITKGFSVELADRRNSAGVIGPVLITGWVGVIIEKITAGYLDRCASDIVAVNSVADYDHFTAVGRRLGLPPDNLLLTGLPFLSPRPQPQRTGPIKRVLYADQPTVPGREVERRYMYQKLVDYAVDHPDREVILKPRHRPGEDTFHRMLYHPENVLAGIDQPANFRIDYTPIGEVLDSIDLMITMSSTACLEALDHGCRVGLVLDLGVHERYGNQVFLDSGLLRTFDALGADQIGTPEPDFLASYFLGRETTATAIMADRTDDLLAAGVRPSHAAWETDYLRSAAEFHHATSAGPGGLGRSGQHSLAALRRRVIRHGRVKGVLAQASVSLLPPILNNSLRGLIKNGRHS